MLDGNEWFWQLKDVAFTQELLKLNIALQSKSASHIISKCLTLQYVCAMGGDQRRKVG